MLERLKHNWWRAVTEVGVSVIGSLGLVLLMSMLASLGPVQKNGWDIFKSYLDGGEIGLSVLSLSGAIYLLLNKIGQTHDGLGLPIYVCCFVPVIAAAYIIGQNPGFEPTQIGSGQLTVLWSLYVVVHIFWFVLLLLQPHHLIPSPETASKQLEERARGIEKRAQLHG